jgi:hypothetical protein
MKKIEVPLGKRSGRFSFYVLISFFIGWLLILAIENMFTKPFSGSSVVLAIIVLGVALAIGIGMYDYITKKEAKLVAESDGETIKFYINSSSGKSYELQPIALSEMGRFYAVEKKARILMITEKYFQFQPKSGLSKEDINIIPDLFKIDKTGVAQIIQFVGEVAPEITLGYGGSVLSTLFKK